MLFVDLFAGCGGLSLGLMQAGWDGLFAIERSEDAFSSLKFNLIEGEKYSFKWPSWLEVKNYEIDEFLKTNRKNLIDMRGEIDLVAGGPPCQGFSLVGRRDPHDPRNQLFKSYLEIVKLLLPRFLLFENVQAFTVGFQDSKKNKNRERSEPYDQLIASSLAEIGYKVFKEVIRSADVGIPQRRKRFLLLAIAKEDPALMQIGEDSPFDIFRGYLKPFRAYKGLPPEGDITVGMAISDLETNAHKLISCVDTDQSGFMQIDYSAPKKLSPYVSLMRHGMNGDMPDSLRLANHRIKTKNKFKKILDTCVHGKNLSCDDRARLGIKKHALMPLAIDQLSATVTTLPDDIIHYSEPRILTVREMARLQSFPDWFSFLGKYTTGNKKRKSECPRYTQVGNAVPPLLAEALGRTLASLGNC
ncbi:MAG: DNA cytosine methyltransferase [Desulfarculaceae bacterium]|nr:DNA cytosine methyltransferase [Desulfarculaceae bacterium]